MEVKILMISVVAIVIVCIVIAVIISVSITKSLNKGIDAVHKVAEGELGNPIDKKILDSLQIKSQG